MCGHLAIVQHSTNFATVHSQVTVGDCSVEYEYKLSRQFTAAVGGTRCYPWLKQSQSNSLRAFLLISQSGSDWKATRYSKTWYQVALQTNYGELEKNFFKNSLCRTNRWKVGIWHSVCNSTSKLTWKFVLILHQAVAYCNSAVYCTAKLVLCWTIVKCPL